MRGDQDRHQSKFELLDDILTLLGGIEDGRMESRHAGDRPHKWTSERVQHNVVDILPRDTDKGRRDGAQKRENLAPHPNSIRESSGNITAELIQRNRNMVCKWYQV